MKKNEFEFKCSDCDEIHKGSPSVGNHMPIQMLYIPEEERETRVKFDSDTCVIDDEEYYIRVTLEIPIHGYDEGFLWGVWVSQSQESFEQYIKYSKEQAKNPTPQEVADKEDPIGSFGWLDPSMCFYNDEQSTAIPCDVYWQPGNIRPIIEPHNFEHQLVEDFTNGICWEEAVKIAQVVMHGKPSN